MTMRLALLTAAGLLFMGLAILCWPLRGAGIRSTALYPNYDHFFGPPETQVRVAVLSTDPLPKAERIDLVVRDRRVRSASLVTAGLLTLAAGAAVRRRDNPE